MIAEAFTKHGIDTDVVKRIPDHKLEISYGSHKVDLGKELTPTQVKDPPTHISWPTEPKMLYTLIMTDPDAPPTLREAHHWLVINIPGTKINEGTVLSEYAGAGPPEESGFHRYVFLVYKQPGGKYEDKEHGHLTNRSIKGRPNFSTSNFATKHKLEGPVAGNFFRAQWDDYVPVLWAQLMSG